MSSRRCCSGFEFGFVSMHIICLNNNNNKIKTFKCREQHSELVMQAVKTTKYTAVGKSYHCSINEVQI